MINNFYTFIVTSTINSEHKFFTSDQKIQQIKNTILSIREKVINSKIVLIDNSIPELSSEIKNSFEPNVDLLLTFENNLFTTFINKSKTHIGFGELLLIETALKEIKKRNLVGKRIFKISGRYILNENFNISKFDSLFGKYTFRMSTWTFTNDNFKNVTYQQYLETRLWSMCYSLIEEYESLMPEIFKFMIKYNKSLEHSKFNILPKEKIVIFDPIGVEGYMSGGDIIKE